MVAIDPKEKFVACFAITDFNEAKTVVLASKQGSIKQVLLNNFQLQRYTKPVRAMKLQPNDELRVADIIDDPLEIMLFTKADEAIRYRASDVPLYGTAAGGLKGINLKPKDEIVSGFYCNKNDDFLILTTRSTIKRMKVEDVPLTKRARAGNKVIKLLKSNPYLIMDAKKMTPNQYKENVMVQIVYKNGNDEEDAKSFKYNVSDCGRTYESKIPELTELVALSLPEPENKDAAPSADYLIEQEQTIFDSFDMGAEEPEPIKVSKKEIKQADILSELDAILAKEKKPSNVLTPEVDDEEDKKDEDKITYKKISLFDN